MKPQHTSQPMFVRYLETPELSTARGGVSVVSVTELGPKKVICEPVVNSSTVDKDVDYDNE